VTLAGRGAPVLTAILVALPMIAVLAAVVQGASGADPALWAHLREYVLPDVLWSTALLVLGVVGAGAAARRDPGLAHGGL
jgi:ABC-type Fe3+ transport system permease subunit